MSTARAESNRARWRRTAQAVLSAAVTIVVVCASMVTAVAVLEGFEVLGPRGVGSGLAVAVVGAVALYGLFAFGPGLLVVAALGLESRRALLVAVVGASLALARLYAFDAYYLPALRRPVELGFWIGWPLLLLVTSCVLVAFAGRHRRLAAVGGAAVTWLALYEVIVMGLH